ncbi:MAG: SUMF1/EgtB/PvdO family nonheme iron enzyme [Phycisphaerae bacterium]|nr:SUMF1/EgtB/PvdO family nonheme iron enzyme [Phycisphaerae bacterium]
MKYQRFRQLCVCSLVGLLATVAQAQTTWYVDDDAPNDPGPGDPMVSDPLEDGSAAHPFDAIQKGIDAAVAANGDDVLVLDGTYTGTGNKDLDFGGKGITVRSENGPDACIIDCQASAEDPHRGFYFHSSETDTSVVEGFTIQNGYVASASWYGGGISCDASSPEISDCTISGNTADIGGGICCDVDSDPLIRHCTIADNTSYWGGGIGCLQDSDAEVRACTITDNTAVFGGGIHCIWNSNPTITDCTIACNTVDQDGGGIYCEEDSNLAISGCTITENTASAYGGAIFHLNSSSDATIASSTIMGNTANWGGGIYFRNGDPTVSNCTIEDNTAGTHGGGVFCDGNGFPTIANSMITGNIADSGSGGGILSIHSDPTIGNCTITNNTADDYGGGIYCYYDGNPIITDCILWENTASQGPEIAVGITENPSTLTVSYSDVQGGEGAAYVDAGCTLNWGDGNIDADPLFVLGPGGCYYLSQTAAGQAEQSLCLDAGSDTAANLGLDTLTTRTDEAADAGIVDMGYHHPVLGTGIVGGDMDFDGDVDFDDLAVFVPILLGSDTDPCRICKADMNGDGLTNGLDIQPFIDALLDPYQGVMIETVTVGNPGNPDDTIGDGYGCVAYTYNIGKYEVTAEQYCGFLNAVAAEDTYGLYDTMMWSSSWGCQIERTGSPGSYAYGVAQDWAKRPVNNVSWGDAARFCNWLHNGQATGVQDPTTTEDGSYFLDGAMSDAELLAITREPDATWVIPSEDEWYKAAYHKNDGVTGNYWVFQTQSDTVPTHEAPPGTDMANGSANYYDWSLEEFAVGSPYYRTEAGAYDAKPSNSAYGTFDQGGNVSEWTEAVTDSYRRARGGSFYDGTCQLLPASYHPYLPTTQTFTAGFRVAEVP